jgi:protein SCO1
MRYLLLPINPFNHKGHEAPLREPALLPFVFLHVLFGLLNLCYCLLLIAIFATVAVAEPSAPTPGRPSPFVGIGIDQQLNQPIPLDTLFRDEQGNLVPLGKFFHTRPVLLVPMYYQCPMLCSQVLSAMVAGLRPLSIAPGKDFDIVSISFNPADTSADAVKNREFYSHRYSTRRGTAGWHFLTGSDDSIHAVMNALGYHYRYDPVTKTFVHASGIMVLTPDGRIARYLYGVDYEPKDLELGLVEASRGKVGSIADQILLFCYHYDASTGKYTATVLNVLRLGAALTVLILVIILGLFFRFDLRRHRAVRQEARLR